MQYLLLIYSDEAIQAGMSPAQGQQYLADYGTFTQDIIAKGQFKAGDALVPTSRARSVRVRNGELAVSQGPFAETTEALGGYYLVEAASMDEACAIAARIPTAKHGTIEVREIMVWNQ